jgi:hypothetical protein
MSGNFPVPKLVTSESFGQAEYGELLLYVDDMVKFLKAKTRGIREELMPKWVRIYRGVPAEETRSWPWPGASNLVIQLAATHADELLSRVMAIYAQDDLFKAKLLGNFDQDSDMSGERQKDMIEEFLTDASYEPDELDLYHVEETGFSSAIRYGTGIFKFPWEYVTEREYTYLGGGMTPGEKLSYNLDPLTRRDGPRPMNVPLSDFGIDPRWKKLDDADFFYHTKHLSTRQLKNLKQFPEIYAKEAIEKILGHPDQQSEFDQQQEAQKKVETQPVKVGEMYDIEECWFIYNKGPDTFRLVCNYHLSTETNLGIFYNPYPENECPFEDAKLAYDDDTYFGYGFCEMLESYQREVSTTHNWRTDNRHFATTGVGRINKNSKLSSIIQLFPGCFLPADQGEIEPLQFGAGALQYGTEDEMLTLSLAKERSGVDPAIGGAGGGIVNPKRGVYSAQGTSIVMQQQNNRNNLRMSDMRSAHVRIGRKVLRLYSYFGVSAKRLRSYGDRSELLKTALESYKSGKLGLVIRPATASQNREMEKQNDILITSTLERLYAGDLQLMQAVMQQGAPPELVDYIKAQFRAKNTLMKRLLRNFGRADDDALVPIPDLMKQQTQRSAQINGTGQKPNGGVSPQTLQQSPQAGGMVPVGSGTTSGTVPQ